MNRLKALTLGLVVVISTSALIATAAQAAEYHVESATGYLFGESSDVLTVLHSPENTELNCTSAKLSGEMSEVSQKGITLHPEYTGCEINEVPAKVETKSCNYLFEEPNASLEAAMSVVNCPTTASITAKTTGCTITVHEQTGTRTVKYDNTGSGATRDIDMTVSLTNVVTTQSAGCPGGAGTFLANYGSVKTMRAYKNPAHTTQQGLWVA